MEHAIILSLDNIEQLIPSQEHNLLPPKAIDSDYADYLYDEINARGGYDTTVKIEIRLPKDQILRTTKEMIEKHFKSYFSYKELTTQGELTVLYRTGRNRLITSIIGLTIILFLAYLVSVFITNEFFASLFTGVFTVLCWVSIWLPFQTLVFDKWPIKRQLAVYGKLKHAIIHVIPMS